MLLSSALCILAIRFVEATRSPGCDKPFEFPVEIGGSAKGIQIGDRRTWVTLPKDYKHKEAAPLILAFHDRNQTPNAFQEITRLSDSVLNPNAIVLYPEAVKGTWISDDMPNVRINDKGFVSNLLDGISDRLCIDTERIYATGLGTGGGMTNLLACDPQFAKRIAAFVLVNPLLQTGGIDFKDVKDEVSMLWGNCKPARVPVRIMEIHGSNNTEYNYWGKGSGKNKRGRTRIVHWLVEWALRNECGAAEGSPNRELSDDTFYETKLQAGHIYEGIVFQDKLQKAVYKCWDSNKTDKKEAASEKAKKKMMSNLERLKTVKGSIVLEHFFVKNYKHGWPYITWKDNDPVDISSGEVDLSPQTPTFDATKEAMRWFDMFRLSDDARAPSSKKPEELDPLAGLNMNDILEEISNRVEEAEKNTEGDERTGTTAQKLDMAVESDEQDQTIVVQGKQKDEL